MSIETTRDNVISAFLALWSETTVETDNVQGQPDGSEYVYIRLAPNFSEQPCLGRDAGATWERDIGDVIIGVYIPVNSSIDGLAMAERARRLLSQQRFAETITQVGYTVPAGIGEDARYYVWNVRLPYRTDNLK